PPLDLRRRAGLRGGDNGKPHERPHEKPAVSDGVHWKWANYRTPTFDPKPRPISVAQLQPELDLPRIVGRGDGAEGGRAAIGVGGTEVRLVEQVEHLGAELEPRAAPAQIEHLAQGEIELEERIASYGVALRVAEGLAGIGRDHHRVPVEVVRRRAVG